MKTKESNAAQPLMSKKNAALDHQLTNVGSGLNSIFYPALTVTIATMFRWATALGPYSGEKKAPMFGDYEAQRHWMEITYHTPVREWYWNTSRNDLQYWGLDYPPLTAYHSYLLGAVSHRINESWAALEASRGLESYGHRVFMRYSVLIPDVLIYFTAVILYVFKLQKSKADVNEKCIYLGIHLLYPGFLLIDHAHFQYNCVSLGLFLWSVNELMMGHDLLGSVCFVAALNYKQMELYHALPIFTYLMSACLRDSSKFNGLFKLIKLGVTVILTFALIWWPFLYSVESVGQVLHRLFPFARGIYEDKVANLWCSLSVVFKWKQLLNQDQMTKLCLVATGASLLPGVIFSLAEGSKRQLKYHLITSSLCFFLFSFQVHEKTILLVALPVLLVIHEETEAAIWFLNISVISMFPLIIKDGTVIAFFATSIAYVVFSTDFRAQVAIQKYNNNNKQQGSWTDWLKSWIQFGSVLVGLGLCAACLVLTPPAHLPDLFPLLISVYCAGHFILFLAYFYWKQFQICRLGIGKLKTA